MEPHSTMTANRTVPLVVPIILREELPIADGGSVSTTAFLFLVARPVVCAAFLFSPTAETRKPERLTRGARSQGSSPQQSDTVQHCAFHGVATGTGGRVWDLD